MISSLLPREREIALAVVFVAATIACCSVGTTHAHAHAHAYALNHDKELGEGFVERLASAERYVQEARFNFTNNNNAAVPPYDTYTVLVPMRDGVMLNTVVFVPKQGDKKHDTLMVRTPYGTDSLKSEGEQYVTQGYAAVMQDFRGRYASHGQFACWFNASTDAYDTIMWTIAQPWSSGIVYQQGSSAPGIAAYMSELADLNPLTVRALFPVVGTAELHRTIFQGGAYRYSLIHGWLTAINESAFEQNFTTHEGLTSFYDNVTFTNQWSRVSAPAIHLTGWYDIFNQQQLDAFDGYIGSSGTSLRTLNRLVVLPTGHCQGGEVAWPYGINGFQLAQELTYLLFKAVGSHPNHDTYAKRMLTLPNMYWYVMGPGLPSSTGNYWTSGNTFPKAVPIVLYLGPNGTMSGALSATSDAAAFVYDPRNPVPTLGGNNLVLPTCGPWDQAKLLQRADVLSFTTPRLNNTMAVTGHVTALFYVSTNCTDTDFTAKLIDVFPNGTKLLVQDGIARLRWRQGGASPVLAVPGTIYPLSVDIWSTSYVFNVGHAVSLAISSSNSPRFSVNPNNGRPLADTTTPPEIARNTVHFGGATPSTLSLPVVNLSDMKQINIDAEIIKVKLMHV